jgi:hypothetical protein
VHIAVGRYKEPGLLIMAGVVSRPIGQIAFATTMLRQLEAYIGSPVPVTGVRPCGVTSLFRQG